MCICYGPNVPGDLRCVTLNDECIPWQNSVKYLGIILAHDLSDTADICKKKGEFIASVNKLNATFTNVPCDIKISLLQTYCTAWYGCQTWQLGTPGTVTMDVQWRKAVRRTMGLPVRTRSALLPGLAGNPTFYNQHEKRVASLLKGMEASSNKCVQYIAQRASMNTTGPLGKNRVYLRHLVVSDLTRDGDDAENEFDTRIAQIRELLRIRDGTDRQDVIEPIEVTEILDYVCTY